MQQGRGDDEALAHPMGVTLDQFLPPVLEVGKIQEPLGPFLPAVLRPEVMEAGDEFQEFPAGQFFVKVRPVGDVAQNGLGLIRLPAYIFPVEENPAGSGFHQAGHHADGRRLSRSVRAQETEDLPRGDPEGEVTDGMERAEYFGQMIQLDQRTSLTCTFNRPMTLTRSSCRSRSPSARRMWVASAGSWLSVESTETQEPR